MTCRSVRGKSVSFDLRSQFRGKWLPWNTNERVKDEGKGNPPFLPEFLTDLSKAGTWEPTPTSSSFLRNDQTVKHSKCTGTLPIDIACHALLPNVWSFMTCSLSFHPLLLSISLLSICLLSIPSMHSLLVKEWWGIFLLSALFQFITLFLSLISYFPVSCTFVCSVFHFSAITTSDSLPEPASRRGRPTYVVIGRKRESEKRGQGKGGERKGVREVWSVGHCCCRYRRRRRRRRHVAAPLRHRAVCDHLCLRYHPYWQHCWPGWQVMSSQSARYAACSVRVRVVASSWGELPQQACSAALCSAFPERRNCTSRLSLRSLCHSDMISNRLVIMY